MGRRLFRLIMSDNLDLWLLTGAAAVFTALGVVGVVDQTQLASAILALLALLAVAQLRSRREVAAFAASGRVTRTSVLQDDFPGELARRRANARDVLLIGIALSRTMQTYREAVRHSLAAGARVRVMVVDPELHDLLRLRPAGETRRGRQRIEHSLAELAAVRSEGSPGLEVRVAPFLPSIGVNALDPAGPDGLVVVQHYEFEAENEPTPILVLTPDDGRWYHHFLAEAERMWSAGSPWPRPTGSRVKASAGHTFQEEWGPELLAPLQSAQQMLITGVARNNLIVAQYRAFETAVRRGCRFRVLLIDPASAAVALAADRYYAERSADSLRTRIQHSARLLGTLNAMSPGAVELRYTTHPVAMATIAVDNGGGMRAPDAALLCEYFTYRAAGEPKFVLGPADGAVYDTLLGEAELLWDNGAPVPLS